MVRSVGEDADSRTVIYCCWEWNLVQLLWKTVLPAASQVAKPRVPRDPAFHLLRIYPGERKHVYTKTCARMFAAALFITAKRWKQPKCPLVGEWIEKKMWCIHTMKYLALKGWNTDTCYNVDEPWEHAVKEAGHNGPHIVWREGSGMGKAIEKESRIMVA